MEQSKKFIIIKLLFNSFILLSAVLTVLFGIFQVTLDLQEFENSEPFSMIWNYGLFYIPTYYYSIMIHSIIIVLSIFFLQGVFIQFISYKKFDHSYAYYFSLILMTLGLLGCLFIPMIDYGIAAGDRFDFFYYWNIEGTRILSGFYWGLLSIILIVIRQITIRILEDLYN